MKKLTMFGLALVGLLAVACSSDKDVAEDVNTPDVSLDGTGQGFLNIGINLPTQPVVSTRADGWQEDEKLDDGLPAEYAVDEVLLIIFGGADEANATAQQLVSLTANPWDVVGSNTDQVTTKKNYVIELDKAVTGPKYYVLAVINSNGIIGISADGTKVKINGTEKAGCKLSDLQGAISDAAADGTTKFINANGHFFMTNAVLNTTPGGTAAPTEVAPFVLAPVTAIYSTEEAAESADDAPSADIYVERGMAKVTVETNGTSFKFDSKITIKDGTATPTLKTPALSGWVLDNTNMHSYVVRQCPADLVTDMYKLVSFSAAAATDKYRFVGLNSVDQRSTPVTTAYRTYWAKDPNYDTSYDKDNFYQPSTVTFPASTTDPQYCFENTFDVANQTYQNTTRVVVKLDLNGGVDFYTIGSDRKTLYTESEAKKVAYGHLILAPAFQAWFAAKKKTTVTTLDESCIKSLTWSSDDKAGVIKIEDITVDGDKLTAGSDVTLSTINETIGGETVKGADILAEVKVLTGTIKRYVKGATYYSLRVKHFGDDLTPWNNGEYNTTAPAESGINDIYPNDSRRDANYLGRYGMVRNNWYEIKLNSIIKIGSAVVPTINPTNPNPDPDDPDPEDPEHPDDSLDDTYINARINILSWAKRTQGWNLRSK